MASEGQTVTRVCERRLQRCANAGCNAEADDRPRRESRRENAAERRAHVHHFMKCMQDDDANT
jgi:hypothetical protein